MSIPSPLSPNRTRIAVALTLLSLSSTFLSATIELDPWAHQRLAEAAAKVERLAGDPTSIPGEVATSFADLAALQQAFGLFEQAATSLERAAELAAPTEARWHAALARPLALLGRRDAAIAACRVALERDPLDYATRVLLGELLLDGESWDEASAALEAAIGAEAFRARARWGLARVALGRGDDAAAVPLMEAVLAEQPAASAVRYPLAQALRRSGELARAREQLAVAGDDPVTMPDWWEAQVGAQLTVRPADRVRAELEAGLQPGLLYDRASRNLGPTQAEEADLLAAAQDAEQPASLRARYFHALAGLAAGRDDVTLEASRLDQALQLDRELVDAHVRRADLLARRQQLDEAAGGYRTALELAPRQSEALFKLASIEAFSGRLEPARNLLQRLAESDPGNVDGRLLLGQVWERLGDPASAAEQYQAALATEMPQSTRAGVLHRLMRLRLAAGDPTGALELGRQALDADAGNVAVIADTASALIALGRFPAAIQIYQQWVELEPDDPGPWALYAGALLLDERWAEARDVLDQALERHPDDLKILDLQARHLAASDAPGVRDGQRALALAQRAFDREPTTRRLETLAMAHAAAGDYATAASLQAQLIAQLERGGRAAPSALARLRDDLARYRALGSG
jgi:tetratricopeptide (TPR) repeat protein